MGIPKMPPWRPVDISTALMTAGAFILLLGAVMLLQAPFAQWGTVVAVTGVVAGVAGIVLEARLRKQ